MTTKESAEQILSAISKTERGGDFPGVTYERREGCPLGLQEQYEVAWEYLRLVDESPVDKAWLRSVGFTDDRAGCPTLGPLHIQSQPFQRPGRNTEYPAYACIRSLPIPIPKTRQDVRELCRLLGIPLQEPTV